MPQVEKGCLGMFRKQSVQADYSIGLMRQCCDMKVRLSNRKLGARRSRTREFAGKFNIHLRGNIITMESLKKGSDTLKFVFLSDCPS